MKKYTAASAEANSTYAHLKEMAINESEYPVDGYQPFTYAIVFDDGDFYIGCKYGNSIWTGTAHPSMLHNGEEYNSSSVTVQERIASGDAHSRHVIGLGDKHEVTAMEKTITQELWDVPGRLNLWMPTGKCTRKHTQEAKGKIGAAAKGRVRSQEVRDKLSIALHDHHDYKWPQARRDQLLNLVAEGLPWYKIAKIMGNGINTVRSRYKMYRL